MTLKELIDLCTTIEEGKILRGKVDGADVNAVSTYKSNKKQPTTEQQKRRCRRCGGNHEKKDCEVKNVHCSFCNVDSHNTTICFKKKRADKEKTGTNNPNPSAVSTNTMQSQRDWCFQMGSGKKQPMVTLLGQLCNNPDNDVFEVDALADTGAEQCIMDETCFKAIPRNEVKLDRSNTFISCANGSEAEVIGETEFRFKVKKAPEHKVRTKVIVAKNLNKQLILSESALKELSIVSPDFPEVYDFDGRGEANSISASIYKSSDYAECGCLKRAETPAAPAKPPFELNMSNRKKIEQFILEYYAASAFNKCEHQELPVLTGPPMEILIDENMVKSRPVNMPATVALNWQKKVKDDIDRDV